MRKAQFIGLLAAVAGTTGGCGEVEDPGFLAITQVSRYEIDSDGCGPPDKELLPSLFYDAGVGAASGAEYSLGIWLFNSLWDNSDGYTRGATTGRTNTNRVQVDRMVVEFIDRERWGFLPESIEVGMPFLLDSYEEIGWPTRLIPTEIAKVMVEHSASPIRREGPESQELLDIRIRAKGKLLDGTDVESGAFDLRLTVCNRCLYGGCPPGYEIDKGCSFAQPDLYECKEAEEGR